jgi:hypothetical protein
MDYVAAEYNSMTHYCGEMYCIDNDVCEGKFLKRMDGGAHLFLIHYSPYYSYIAMERWTPPTLLQYIVDRRKRCTDWIVLFTDICFHCRG